MSKLVVSGMTTSRLNGSGWSDACSDPAVPPTDVVQSTPAVTVPPEPSTWYVTRGSSDASADDRASDSRTAPVMAVTMPAV